MPVEITGTGHTVGVTYANHYWGGTYTVLAAEGEHNARIRWNDGREAVSGTRLDLDPVGHPGRDHPVSERCVRRLECRKRDAEL